MKKILFIPILALVLFVGAPSVQAAVGDSCVASDPLACTGTPDIEVCDTGTSKCIGQDSPSTPAATTAQPNSAAQGSTQSSAFVPLLPSLPGISSLETNNDLAPFLSQVYKICIGLAAVLAVLQLMRAGVMYMGGDSITEKKEARELITLSIIGLILVLSPVIVFSIINPNILHLNINATSLQTSIQNIQNGASNVPASSGNVGGGSAAPPSVIQSTGQTNPACTLMQDGQEITTNQQEVCCQNQESATVSCNVAQQTRSNGTFYRYCSCAAK